MHTISQRQIRVILTLAFFFIYVCQKKKDKARNLPFGLCSLLCLSIVLWRIEDGGLREELIGRASHLTLFHPSTSQYGAILQVFFKRLLDFQLRFGLSSMLKWVGQNISLRARWHFAVTVTVVLTSPGFSWCTNTVWIGNLWYQNCAFVHTLDWIQQWENLGTCYICTYGTFIRLKQIISHQHLYS